MPIREAAFLLVAFIALAGCDQISPNRYEIAKDQSGRTLRLDKRTGEVSVIEGERIAPIRDARTVDTEKFAKLDDLARAKDYPDLPLKNFGFDATFRTSWQDGKLMYVVRFAAPRKAAGKPDSASTSATVEAPKGEQPKAPPLDWLKFSRYTWHLLLEDSPFELAKETLSFIGVVDDSGKVEAREAKGSIAMSSDTYRRIDGWNIMWRPRV